MEWNHDRDFALWGQIGTLHRTQINKSKRFLAESVQNRTNIYIQQENKTEEKKMMRIILLAFIAIVGLTQAQRTPKPPPPPPGFESGSGSKGTGISFTGKNQNRNRESSARPQGFSPFTSKWVYCNGSWKLVMFTMKESKECKTQHPQLFKVDKETCPAVFHDSDFSDYRAFCR